MSDITTVVLLVSHVSPEALPPWLEHIRQWRYQESVGFPLVSLVDASLPERWYGGDALVGAGIAIGALNHLPLEAYLAFLRGLPWQELGRPVQLAVHCEWDDGYRLYPIYPVARAMPNDERERALMDMATILAGPHPPSSWQSEPILKGDQWDHLDDAVRRYLGTRGFVVEDKQAT
jgi:hypothetical protein